MSGEDGIRRVFVGGRLMGSFGAKDSAERNVMLIALSEEPKAHLGDLANAFEISTETLRELRLLVAREGIEAATRRRRGGSASRALTGRDRAKVLAAFEGGASVEEAWAKIGRRASRATVGRLKKEWEGVGLGLETATGRAAERADESPAQRRLDELVAGTPGDAEKPGDAAPSETGAPPSETEALAETSAASAEEGATQALRPQAVTSSRGMQHAGTWLMIAMLHRLGLYAAAEDACADASARKSLRIAVDAFVCALALGEGCVEGVRRLMTPSGPALLRANRVPSATWVRRELGAFSAKLGGARLHFSMARRYARAASAETERDVVVFYIDNHLRPYTGKETIRKGWRMQDKRVRPGVTDVYVHDEVGNPVLRVADATNGSLTKWLSWMAKTLRELVGAEARIVLAFDRGGAFAEQLAELRDMGFEVVTYERKPYPLLASSAFDIRFTHDDETLEASDARTNLGSGHGRVRRVALRTSDGRQVNPLAVGKLSVSELYAILRGRWVQENGFHHQVHRWGINQLDGRTTVPSDPDEVIPNPARRRLDRQVRLARVTAGLARNELAARPEGDPRRARWEAVLSHANQRERELVGLRPTTPKRAPVCETELADKLVRHPGDYKMALDSVRIACANAESDLAATLAEAMVLPGEAKKLLANVLRAPGHVVSGKSVITVRLAPAANRSEREAISALLARCNRLKLTLPGDLAKRPLRFQSQNL